MNVLKNMEAIFIVAVALAVSASAFAAPAPMPAHAKPLAGNGKMIQVVIKGKRLSAVQKAQLALHRAR